MSIDVVNVTAMAAEIKKPWDPVEAAQVDELGVYVLIAHGRLGWHRHLDEDELFLVLHGSVGFDSEWGSVTAHAGEFVLIPKGVGHRASSLWRSSILLIRPRILANEQNGQRRLFAPPDQEALRKVALSRTAGALPADFSAHSLATLGAYRVELLRGMGFSPLMESAGRAHLLLVHSGRVAIEEPAGETQLSARALAVIPKGRRYRLACSAHCIVLRLGRG